MRYFFQIILIAVLGIIGCRQIDVYEKITEIPGQQWHRSTKAIVEIDVKDSSLYNLIFVTRHTEKFEFTNLLTTLSIKDTAINTKPVVFMRLNIPLINKTGNWAGDNMNDLYYHRVRITPPVFLKPGRYQFVMQHEMKKDPLPYIFNVGIAIKKAPSL